MKYLMLQIFSPQREVFLCCSSRNFWKIAKSFHTWAHGTENVSALWTVPIKGTCLFRARLFCRRWNFFSPLPQDRILHRCQLGGRGLHMQWCSRMAFPVRRCAQVTCRDWKPCRPQVAVHGVHGPARQWRAQASVEQFFRELGLHLQTQTQRQGSKRCQKHSGKWPFPWNNRYHCIFYCTQTLYTTLYWYLPLESTAHPGGDFGGVCVLAVNMSVLCGQTGTHTLTVTLKGEISSKLQANSAFKKNSDFPNDNK